MDEQTCLANHKAVDERFIQQEKFFEERFKGFRKYCTDAVTRNDDKIGIVDTKIDKNSERLVNLVEDVITIKAKLEVLVPTKQAKEEEKWNKRKYLWYPIYAGIFLTILAFIREYFIRGGTF